ncbi:MAG: hypothetical protein M1829_000527 [Trizodia sp. TS-e1964]|nr:MAG: hypothetical protein M1829_000527 [Trizodia sp. TS-e1964]
MEGTPEHQLVNIAVCSETQRFMLHDGWRSFPSGHSSWAFSGLGYLAFFLCGQLHALRPDIDLARFLIAFSPLLGALLIAISRCEDYRHDVYDVTVGSLLGLLIAYLSYRRYYPRLRARACDIPYSSRAVLSKAKASRRDRDEEEGLVRSMRDYSASGSNRLPEEIISSRIEEADSERDLEHSGQ